MRFVLLLLMSLCSAGALAHGSSHPSCNGIRKDDNRAGYEACKMRQQAAYERAYNQCTATPACLAERIADQKNHEHRAMAVLVFAAIILIGLFMPSA